MSELFSVILVVAVVGGFWWSLRGRRATTNTAVSSSRRSAKSRASEAPSPGYHWPGTGDFEFEVVGESFYQNDLSRLAGPHGKQSAEVQATATLLLEDNNKHDPKAVAVIIDGSKVAHLTREDARSFRRRLGAKKLSGSTTTCDALIVGGGTGRDGEKLMYGVKLDMKPFE